MKTRSRQAVKPGAFSISKHLPLLFLLVFLSFFAHLGNTPLFDADEGAYSEVTREMLASQDFTSIMLNGMPFPHKPPLFYWAQAASVRILGLTEFALRLPSAIAAVLWAASIFLFTRRFYDTRTAWYGTLFMCGSLLVSLAGRSATPETLFNLFLTLTLLNIYKFYQSGSKRHIYWSFMFAALGVLTKGALAILLPIALSLLFFGSRKRWQQLRQLLCNPVGLIVFGLVVMPWYLGEFMLHGEAFLSDLLMLPGMAAYPYGFIGSSLPYSSYPAFILLGLLPFSGLAFKAFFQLGKALRDDLMKFLLLWVILAFLLLPLAQPRSLSAIASCCPPLFIIMARAVDSLRHLASLVIWPLACAALLLLIPFVAPYGAGAVDHEFFRSILASGMEYFDPFYRLTLAGAMLLFAVLPFIRAVPLPVKYAIVGLLFVSLVNFLVLPIAGTILQQPVKSAGILARRENLPVVKWRIDPPSFNVYAEKLTEVRSPRAGDTVLTRSVYLENLSGYEPLFEKGGIVLVKFLKNPVNNRAGAGGEKE